MTTLAWSVQARGGDPGAIRAAIESGLALLRSAQQVPDLSSDEQDYWREDVHAVSVGEVIAHPGEDHFALVELTVDDAAESELKLLAAMLCGGFDTAVLDAVMAVEDVTLGTYTSLGEPPF